jgi:hypothetical protein
MKALMYVKIHKYYACLYSYLYYIVFYMFNYFCILAALLC